MTIAPRCTNAQCRTRLAAVNLDPGGTTVQCPRCETRISFGVDDKTAASQALSNCPVCGGVEFFVRKDFPQRLGLVLVVVFGLIATFFYYRENIVGTFVTLFSLVIVDALIYLFVGKVIVCYRCRAEFRNVAYNPEHGGFDLATSEKYD